jgi:creatinine amidohydrolase
VTPEKGWKNEVAMPARFWLDLTTEDFRSRDGGRAIAVLPVAAVEQHGPHLPVGVDAVIAEGYLARVMALVPDRLDVLVLPTQNIGVSNEHRDFPGTLTLSPETAIRAWTEIGESVRRMGVSKLVIVSSHGGNSAVVDIVAQKLRIGHGMLVVTTGWHRFGYPVCVFADDEVRHGIHGGDIETSLMLAFKPDTVRMGEAKHFVPRTVAMEREFKHLRASRPAGFAWMAQDLHPDGAMGDATRASAEKGNASADFGARTFIDLLHDVDRFALDAP